ncbi:hypothetical protein C8A01DRAFT_15001 [Parachaetomium inaequale]|uniref:Mitochondrial inner membrane protein 1 n=1 Tax=Parachaetomium inaequale TaxID=2588326 RepID=A0AAN6SSS4_9PEZI|nr:hypothetical protein C8A01DRAFT_15001 [Parachaetomium inaequale]
MLPATIRARPLRVRPHTCTLAATSRAHPSASFATRTPSSPRVVPRAIAPCGPLQTVFRTQLSTKPPLQPNKIDKEFERQAAEKKLEARPDEVTSSSSVRNVLEASQAPPEDNPDLMVGLKNDLNTVKDTFALKTVPREAFTLGLAGTLPYLATSLSTVVLSWNLNTDWPTQSHFLNAFLLNHESAAHWLHILEPIQVGYGAVIISFLGAIHWGLEFAERQPGGDRTRLRYGIGVLAPAVAWPTIFMPLEWALTTQFAAFASLYYADSRATVKGWAPAWYGSYRFVLTAVVGVAILVSLIGRAKVGKGQNQLTTAALADRIKAKPKYTGKHHNWAKEEEEERERIREEKQQEEKKRKGEEKKAKEEEEKKKKKQAKQEEGAADIESKDEDQKEDQDREEGGASFKSNEGPDANENQTDDAKQKNQQE